MRRIAKAQDGGRPKMSDVVQPVKIFDFRSSRLSLTPIAFSFYNCSCALYLSLFVELTSLVKLSNLQGYL